MWYPKRDRAPSWRQKRWPQPVNEAQDLSEQRSWDGDLRQPESDIAVVVHELGADLDQYLWQRDQRPVFHFFRQSESQKLMLWTAPATAAAMCHSAAALRSGQSPFMAMSGHPAREADQNRREGRAARSLHHFPDGGGRHPKTSVR